MKLVILTAKNPAELEAKANAWLDAHRPHVRSITLSQGTLWAVAIACVDTPDPVPAAERWIGEQLDTGRGA